MTKVTVRQAKTHLSALLRRVEAGEDITICRGRVSVAVLTRATPLTEKNVWGDMKGFIADDFDAPLEDWARYS